MDGARTSRLMADVDCKYFKIFEVKNVLHT